MDSNAEKEEKRKKNRPLNDLQQLRLIEMMESHYSLIITANDQPGRKKIKEKLINKVRIAIFIEDNNHIG